MCSPSTNNMEISSHHEEEDAEIPMPISTSFMGVHTHHGHIQHGHMIAHHPYHHYHNTSTSFPSNNSNNGGTSCAITTTNATLMKDDLHHNSNGNNHDDDDGDDHDDEHDDLGSKTKKKMMMMMVRYKECQKNHAASMGGNATDGCGEFMPSGEEGTLESLTCLACNCHRNFHRKEIQGDEKYHFNPSTPHQHLLNTRARNVILGNNPNFVGPLVPYSRSLTITMPSTYTHTNQSHHNHHGNNNGGGLMNMMVRPNNNHDDYTNQVVKKRFRTKFSQEQKEKMLEFAEKVGWKIQKLEESVVQQFCAEVGVKRRVLKVWMHNNKYNLAKKNYNIIDNDNNNIINDNNSC